MSVGFARRWTFDPGTTVLLQVEGVDIIDREPPQSVIGVGSGTACIVGEFENGPFGVTTEVTSYTQLKSTFGTFGYSYNNTVGNNPCARQRFADGAVLAETWNGNGAVQLSGKKFSRLLIMRADTSLGTVQFTRQANLLGGLQFRYSLLTGQHLDISVDAGAPVVATFTGVAATVTSAAQTYAAIVAGDTFICTVDAQPLFTAVFQAADTTQAAVIARINQFAGFTFATVASGTTIALTARQAGTGGQIVIGAGTANAAGKLNFTAATTAGTGNVANISSVAPSEVNTIVFAALPTVKVEALPNGQLRMYRISATPATDSVKVAVATTALALGFPINVTSTATTGNAGLIPAGTVVQVVAGNVYVTMQDIVATATAVAGQTASGAGPYPVKIRAATDDGVTVSTTSTTGTITQVTNPILLDSYAVTNLLTVNASLTEAAIDAAYVTAISNTLNQGDVSHDINLMWSARQSNAVRRQLKANVLAAGDGGGAGVLGRMVVLRPPVATLEATALSGVVEPGVGAYSTERVIYTWPSVTTLITPIATVGLAGGTGFTASGIVTVGADGVMVSVCSQLNPEENPGQLTAFTGSVVGIEPNVNGGNPLQQADYILLKANGIAAPRISTGTMIFQSGVTSVNPLSFPAFAPIHRRRMADYIQDSLATALDPFVKRLMTLNRRKACEGMARQFLLGLLSPTNANSQRIGGFFLDAKTPNLAPAGGVSPMSLGLFRMIILVQTLPSMDDIVLDTTIGDTVNVQAAS